MNAGLGSGCTDDVGQSGSFVCAFVNSNDDHGRANLFEDCVDSVWKSAAGSKISSHGAAAGNQNGLVKREFSRGCIWGCADQSNDRRAHRLDGPDAFGQTDDLDPVQEVSGHWVGVLLG